MQTSSQSPVPAATAITFSRQTSPEIRYLKSGVLLSVLFFMLSGAVDAGNDWLDRLLGSLMGLCAATLVAMFGVGFVSMANLWRELVLQLKESHIGSLLLSGPVAVVLLALGLAGFILFGTLAEKFFSEYWETRILLWGLITVAFYGLWKGRSNVALMSRLILMVSFSAIILSAAAFSFWWTASQTTLVLVILLSALGFLNTIFYSRWVRLTVLKDNLL